MRTSSTSGLKKEKRLDVRVSSVTVVTEDARTPGTEKVIPFDPTTGNVSRKSMLSVVRVNLCPDCQTHTAPTPVEVPGLSAVTASLENPPGPPRGHANPNASPTALLVTLFLI